MASIKDPHVIDWFRGTMEEIHNKLLVQTSAKISETAVELCQSHKLFLKSAADTCSKKCEDDGTLFETIQTYKKDLEQKTVLMNEKREALSQSLCEVEQKQSQKEDITLKIEKLREEQAKRRDLIVSQHRANKDRLKNLEKAKRIFQEHLGLEIRRTHGEKLQFIFQNVNPASPDNAYTFTMGIKADGSYHIMSSDPVLQSLETLKKRLHETNNISAFLANVRKEFVAQARS
ncbi:Kinetochore protein Spc25 [Merluccius polli]|uniref:Kinetochore protein SPC25 n=1 Tax=Merluccius polli TaxID=89951 RepID=A0AA47N2Y5_MERPO|nr:Kinetochore protein Spc25 [Merluccius polli]